MMLMPAGLGLEENLRLRSRLLSLVTDSAADFR